ncbi:MAG: TRAP transporter large permease [Proteobacteria bacterium]|nr:TRAP transporter large permease [Pseudomonadota bacterium]
MSEFEIGMASVGLMVILIYLGMHVAVALALTSFFSVWIMRGDMVVASKLLALAAEDSIANYVFGVVPLFVLMGLLVSVADVGRDAFDVAEYLFGKIKGGLGIATVGANAIFAAITGVSIASAAVFTRVAVPQMIDRGYHPRFAVGVVAGSSVLGMLIPPSLLMIIYGVLAEVSIGDMFIAGILPGLLLSVVYAVGIVLVARYAPRFVDGEAVTSAPRAAVRHSGRAILGKIAPVIALVGMVFGGIYGGIFTPTEAGAAGALGALVLALLRRRLDFAGLWRVLADTGHITAAICLLFIAATMYSRMLTLSGFPSFLSAWLDGSGFGFPGTLATYVVVVLFLGTILDSTSIMLIMVPLFVPTLNAMDVNLIWFGIVTIIAVEIGLLTPPFGISVYVVKATLNDARVSVNDIFIGAAPFALLMLLVLLAVIAVPWLATGLL